MMVKRGIGIAILFAQICMNLWSQGEDQFLPSEIKQSTVVTEPVSLSKGFFRLGTIVQYGVADKLFDEEGNKDYFLESVWAKDWSYSLLGQYGITDRIQVDVQIPFRQVSYYHSWEYVLLSQGQASVENWNLKGTGLGDMDLFIRYQILTEQARRPSLVGDLSITVPTGRKNPADVKDAFDFKLPTGFGEYRVQLRTQIRKIIYPASYKLYASYTLGLGGTKIFNPIDPQELEFRSGGRLDAGGRVEMLLNDWIALSNDVSFFYSAREEVENTLPEDHFPGWGISYEGGLVFQIRQFRIAEAVGVPLYGKSIPADPYYVLIMQYIF